MISHRIIINIKQIHQKSIQIYSIFFILVLFIFNVNNAASKDKIELSPEELNWISQNHKIRARVGNFPPLMFNKQEISGIAVDYLSFVSKKYDLNVEFISDNIGWSKSVKDIMSGNKYYDLILTMKRTSDREERLALTDDYLFSSWVIITHEDGFLVRDISDLKGKKVSVERGYVMQKKLQKEYPNINLIEVQNSSQALEAVSSGKVDAYIGNLLNSTYLIGNLKLGNLIIAAPSPFGNHNQAMAIRKDWTVLSSIISKNIALMTPQEHASILNKWPSVRYEYGIQKNRVILWISIISLVFVALIGIFLIWNYILKREINKREKVEKNLKETVASLENALKEIKTLQGIIPICSYCHEIRDDRGSWEKIEEYITKNSDATFSHGICPKCHIRVRGEIKNIK